MKLSGDERRAVPAVLDALAASQSRLEEAAQIDPELAPLVGMLESASAQLEEISFTLRDYQAALNTTPPSWPLFKNVSNSCVFYKENTARPWQR